MNDNLFLFCIYYFLVPKNTFKIIVIYNIRTFTCDAQAKKTFSLKKCAIVWYNNIVMKNNAWRLEWVIEVISAEISSC